MDLRILARKQSPRLNGGNNAGGVITLNRGYYAAGTSFSSQNSLAHHGIKEMKWGRRRFQNKDGSLTPEGRIRYGVGQPREKGNLLDLVPATNGQRWNTERAQAKAIKKSQKDLVKRLKKNKDIGENPLVKKAKAELKTLNEENKKAEKEYDELVDKFYKDEKLYEKYLNIAVDRVLESNPDAFGGDRDLIKRWYKYDDGDQGEEGTFEIFINENTSHPLAKRLEKAADKYDKTSSKLHDASEKYAKEMLGAYGNAKVPTGGKMWEHGRWVPIKQSAAWKLTMDLYYDKV